MPPKNRMDLNPENITSNVPNKNASLRCHITEAQIQHHTVSELVIAFIYGKLREMNEREPVGKRILDNYMLSMQFKDVFTNAINGIRELQHQSFKQDSDDCVINEILRLYDTFNINDTIAAIWDFSKRYFNMNPSEINVEIPVNTANSETVTDCIFDEYLRPMFINIENYQVSNKY